MGCKGELLTQDGSMNYNGVLHLHQLQAKVITAIGVWVGHVAHTPAMEAISLCMPKFLGGRLSDTWKTADHCL